MASAVVVAAVTMDAGGGGGTTLRMPEAFFRVPEAFFSVEHGATGGLLQALEDPDPLREPRLPLLCLPGLALVRLRLRCRFFLR